MQLLNFPPQETSPQLGVTQTACPHDASHSGPPHEGFDLRKAADLPVRHSAATPEPGGLTLSEAFGPGVLDASTLGFVLASLPPGPVLWVQDRMSRLELGRPFAPGLGRSLLWVHVPRPADVLVALEEGLRGAGLAAVVGEIWGNPRALTFTTTRRLALRAEARKRPCWLIRHAASAESSAARQRWRMSVAPSTPPSGDPHAPGEARWHAQLFRWRDGATGDWLAHHDRAEDRVDLVAAPRDGAAPDHARATG